MNINKEILRLSVPAIISNVTVPLLGLCDTTISGHLGADSYIGAIAVGSMMLNVTFWLFGFLRMGTTGLTAQAFGRKDHNDISRIFSRAFVLGFGIGLLILFLSIPLRELLLGVISPDETEKTLASSYFSIVIFSAPALLATTSVQGWLFGMQNTLFPMTVSITVNVINIALSLLFVFGMNLGFPGIAYGTLVANWCGLLLALIFARKTACGNLWCGWKALTAGGGIRLFFHVNTDIFFRSGCIIAVSLAVTSMGARLGSLTLATNAVMMQFFHFFSFFMDGFAFTAEALSGRFYGASDFKMLRITVKSLLGWSAAMAVTFFLIYYLFSPEIVGFITDSSGVRENIARYRLWLLLIPPLTVLAFIYDGFFIGLTATRRMLYVTLAAALLFFLICAAGWNESIRENTYIANNILWLAFLSYLLTRGLGLAVQSRKVFSPQFKPNL